MADRPVYPPLQTFCRAAANRRFGPGASFRVTVYRAATVLGARAKKTGSVWPGGENPSDGPKFDTRRVDERAMKKLVIIIAVLIFGTPFVEVVDWLIAGMPGGWPDKAVVVIGLGPFLAGAIYYCIAHWRGKPGF